MKIRFKYAGALFIITFFVLLSACESQKEAVVGVEETNLYTDDKMKDVISTLKAGEKLTVVSALDDHLEIKAPNGEIGWVEGHVLCTLVEFERRKASDEIPERIVTVLYRNGKRNNLRVLCRAV